MSRAARTIRLGHAPQRPLEPVPLDALEDVVAFVLAGMEQLDRAARVEPPPASGNGHPPRAEPRLGDPHRSTSTDRSTHP